MDSIRGIDFSCVWPMCFYEDGFSLKLSWHKGFVYIFSQSRVLPTVGGGGGGGQPDTTMSITTTTTTDSKRPRQRRTYNDDDDDDDGDDTPKSDGIFFYVTWL